MITKFKAFIYRTGCLSLLSILFLSACSGPFVKPVFEPADKDFKGIAQHLKLQKSNQKQKSAVDIILFHGMGIHNEEWADSIFNRMEDLLPEWTRCKCKDEQYCKPLGAEFGPCNETNNGTQDPAIKINTITFTREHDNRKQEIRLHAVIWSGLTTPLKKKLCSDMSEGDSRDRLGCKQEYTRERADFISQLKNDLINTGLSDVVIYLGKSRANIQEAFRSSIEQILNDRNGDANASLVIITSSLASHILIESLCENESHCKEIPKSKDNGDSTLHLTPLQLLINRVDKMASHEIPLSIFMASNQTLLLKLAKNELPTESDLTTKIKRCRFNCLTISCEWFLNRQANLQNPPSQTKRAIEVIAFTDPNDLLSYELEKP